MRAGTCLLPCVSCDVVVTCIPSPNRSPSFEVSTIFPLHEIGDIFVYGKWRASEVQKLIFYCL